MIRRGTKEVETFILNQEYLRHGNVEWLGEGEMKILMERERTMVTDAMRNKLLDSVAKCLKKEMELQNLKKRFWWRLNKKEEENWSWIVGRKGKLLANIIPTLYSLDH